MERERPGIREHVKNVELGLGSIDIIRGSKSAIFFPKTLPSRLNFVERICPPHRLTTILVVKFTHFLSGRAVDTPALSIQDSLSKTAFPYGDGHVGTEFEASIFGGGQPMAVNERSLK